MNTVIVIPARYNSSRFPGKPLVKITGTSMLERCYALASSVKEVTQVYIATDDSRIAEHAQSFGGAVIMTDPNCPNGSERCLAAVEQLDATPDVVINFQGDTPITPPWILQALVDVMQTSPDTLIATPAVPLNAAQIEALAAAKAGGNSTGTLVTFDKNQNALYFSKAMIPFIREKIAQTPIVFKHIGVYAYRTQALRDYCQLEPTPLEKTESLEQLRALENGIPIKIAIVDYQNRTPWSVDTPADIAQVEAIIAREGELLS